MSKRIVRGDGKMNLELLKELEDLKQIQKSLYPKLQQQIDARIQQSITNSFNDFERFFKENDFQIHLREQSIFATYGSLKAALEYEISSDSDTDNYFAFNLIFELPNRQEFLLSLNPLVNTELLLSCPTNPVHAEKIQIEDEIQQVKVQIEKLKLRIHSFSSESWVYKLRLKNQKIKQVEDSIFNSMYELLNERLTA